MTCVSAGHEDTIGELANFKSHQGPDAAVSEGKSKNWYRCSI